jgi:hypothetical protein
VSTFPLAHASSPAVTKVTSASTTVVSNSITGHPVRSCVVVSCTSDADVTTGGVPTIAQTGGESMTWTRVAIPLGYSSTGDVGVVVVFAGVFNDLASPPASRSAFTVTVTLPGVTASKPKLLIPKVYDDTQVDITNPIGATIGGSFSSGTLISALITPLTSDGGLRFAQLDWNATGVPTTLIPNNQNTEVVDSFHNASLSTNLALSGERRTRAGVVEALGAILLASATDGNWLAYELRGPGLAASPFDAAAFSSTDFATAGGGSAFSGSVGLTGSGSLSFGTTPATGGMLGLTGSGSLSFVSVPRQASAVALSGSGSLSFGTAPSTSGAVTLSGSGQLTTSGQVVVVGTLPLSGSGALTFATTPRQASAVALSGSGALSFGATPSTSTSVALAGSGSLTFGASPATGGSVALSGSGSLTMTGRPAQAATLPLTGSGSLTFGTSPAATGAVTLAGSGQLNLSTGSAGSATLNLDGSGQLTTAGTPGLSRTLSLSGAGNLSLGGTPATSRTLALNGSGQLTTGGTPQVGSTVPLAGDGLLSFAAKAAAQAAVTLAGTGLLEVGGRPAAQSVLALSGGGALTLAGVDGPTMPAVALIVGQPRPPRFLAAASTWTAPSLSSSAPRAQNPTVGQARASRFRSGGTQ